MKKQDSKKKLQNYVYKIRQLQKQNKIPKELKKEAKIIASMKPSDVIEKANKKLLEKAKLITSPRYRAKKKLKGKNQDKIKKLKKELSKQVKILKRNELLKEARNRLIGRPKDADQLGEPYYRKMKFLDIYEKGITRINKKGEIKHITGLKAVEMQIESLKRNNNPEYRKEIFIGAYIENLQNVGIDEELIDECKTILVGLEPHQITYLINTGLLPEISFYYILDESDIDTFEDKLIFINDKENWIDNYNKAVEMEEEMLKIVEQEHKIKPKGKFASKKWRTNF